MARSKTDSTVANDELEHTAGGATTRDAMDAGVPMTPGEASEPVGPEDALGAGPTRGDYRDRLGDTVHMETRVIPEDRRVPGGPIYEHVPQGDPENIGDSPGKGGVSTPEALEAAALTAPVSAPVPVPVPVEGDDAPAPDDSK